MKKMSLSLPVFAAIAWAPAQAALAPLLDPYLNGQSIFASTFVTAGAGATVYGSFLAGAGATVDAHSVVTGNLLAAQGATLGLGSTVGGNLLAGAGATLGAGSAVAGSFQAGAGATLGAHSTVGGNLFAGAAATLGVGSQVSGNLVAGAAITLGVGAQVMGTSQASTAPGFSGIPTAAGVGVQATQVANVQTGLRNLAPGRTLGATLGGPISLNAGTYSATALTMAAGTVLTLDAQNLTGQLWVFNIDTALVTGAATSINLINGGQDSSVIWNIGGYTTLGAGTAFMGTLFAKDYVTLGATTKVTGPGSACGGIFSTTSSVVLGAGATVGSSGCRGASNAYWYALNTIDLQNQPTLAANVSLALAAQAGPTSGPGPSQVPEPATLGLVAAGLAGMAFTSRRRSPQPPGQPPSAGAAAGLGAMAIAEVVDASPRCCRVGRFDRMGRTAPRVSQAPPTRQHAGPAGAAMVREVKPAALGSAGCDRPPTHQRVVVLPAITQNLEQRSL